MVLKDIVAFLLCIFVVICDSNFVGNLGRCSIHDSECHKGLFQDILKHTSTGIEILDIPPTDPYHVKNVSVSLYGLVDLTLLDGTVTGIKDCIIDSLDTHIEDERATMEMTCDITVKGLYKVSPASLLGKSTLRSNIVHGQGYVKIKLEKLHLQFYFDFVVERNKNDEVYIKFKNNTSKYKYDILQKITFDADGLYMDNQDISKSAVNMLNEYSSFVMKTFGKPVMDKAVEYFHLYIGKFLDLIPAKYYIDEDLSLYVKQSFALE